jgi:serine/threonine protein kinase
MQSTTSEELIDLISRHQLIEPEALWQYLASRGGAAALPEDAAVVVTDLVEEKLLTRFQGDQILAGEALGLVVGRYRLLERLGSAASSVYLCERRQGPPGLRFALKILPLDDTVPTAEVERFRREAEALARLEHPAIVGIKDSGEDHGRLFLLMERIEGDNLAELVAREGPLPPVPACRLILGALEALDHIHKAGLLHRDLQPRHLMRDREGGVHVIDLGVARFVKESGGSLTEDLEPGRLLGSVEYLSPEQVADSHDVDVRSDVYGLGATFYFLLTGQAPFNQHALLRLAAGVVTHPRPLHQLRPDVPREVVAVVEGMMAIDPAQRFQTPAEAAAALQSWLLEVSPPPLRLPTRRSSTTLPAVHPTPLTAQQVAAAVNKEETAGASRWAMALLALGVTLLVLAGSLALRGM